MPRIRIDQQNLVGPTGNFTQSDPSAGVNAARETQQLGRQIQAIGFDTMERIGRAEDSQKATEAQRASLNDYDSWSAEDEAKNGIEGKSDRANKWWDERMQKDEGSFGNRRAFNLYRDKINPTITKSLYDVQVTERSKRLENIEQGRLEEVDNYATRQISIPDPDQVSIDLASYDKTLESHAAAGSIYKDNIPKEQKAAKNKIVSNMYEGYLQGDEGSVNVGKQLLNGSDERSKSFRDSLTSDQFKSLHSRFQSRTKELNQTNLAEQRRSLADIVAELKMGGDPDIASGEKMMGYIANNPESRKEETARMANEWRAAKTLGSAMKRIKMASPEEMSKVRSEFVADVRGKDKTFGAATEFEMQRVFDSQLGMVLTQRNADPFSYVLSNDTELQRLNAVGDNRGALDRAVTLQKQIGIAPNLIRVSSTSETDTFATQIKALDNPAQMETVVKAYQDKYGAYAGKFFKEAAGERNDLADFSVAGMMSDQSTRRSIIENVMIKDDINKAFKDNPSLSIWNKSIKEEVESQTQDMSSALVNGTNSKGSLQTANAIKAAVEAETRKLYAKGLSKDSPSNVVKKAYQTIMERNFQIEPVTNRSTIIIRKTNGVPSTNPDDIREFVATVSTAKGIEALEPWGVEEQHMKMTGLDKAKTKEALIDNLKRNHRWITNDTQDGLLMVWDGGDEPVSIVKLVDGKKVPIEIPFNQVQSQQIATERKIKANHEAALKADPNRVTGRQGFGNYRFGGDGGK